MHLTSRHQDRTYTGTRQELIRKYEGYGYGALKAGDHVEAHIYFQQSEHYKRMR